MPAPRGLAALYLLNPSEAGRRLRAAIRDARGDLPAAAKALGPSTRTLHYWIERFPGGRGFATCREWVDAKYPQKNNPRRIGRRRATEKDQTGA